MIHQPEQSQIEVQLTPLIEKSQLESLVKYAEDKNSDKIPATQPTTEPANLSDGFFGSPVYSDYGIEERAGRYSAQMRANMGGFKSSLEYG